MPTRKAAATAPKRSFHCKICDRKIPMPKGWGVGSASRRHYWAKHPEVMRGDKGAGRR
jgi:hypothetical protein